MQAPADQNYIRVKMGVLNTDGITTVPIKCADDGAMLVNEIDTISFTMTPIDERDENYKNCLMWVGTDGLSYPWVCNADGEVLVEL